MRLRDALRHILLGGLIAAGMGSLSMAVITAWLGLPLTDLFSPGAQRSHAFSEWDLLPGRTGVRLSLRTVRTRDAKLTVDLISGAGELYDLGADPHELRNLWDDPAARPLRARLMALADTRPDDLCAQSEPVGIA